jgi:cell wall-associated NlpC family hydrolase
MQLQGSGTLSQLDGRQVPQGQAVFSESRAPARREGRPAVDYVKAVFRFTLLAGILSGLLITSAAPVAAEGTELTRLVNVAKAQIGDPWKHYAKGPDKFDCVGFVFFVYNQNGIKERIGGYKGVYGYLKWFRDRGLVTTDKTKARPGDLIIWGRNQHIGMYLGEGMAISALLNPHGVSIHKVSGYVPIKVKAYLRVNIER